MNKPVSFLTIQPVLHEFGGLAYPMSDLERNTEPSCMNGRVNFRMHRVTVEVVDEPKDVLAARLQKLWATTDNHHHRGPLRKAAESIGYALVGEMGAARRGRS